MPAPKDSDLGDPVPKDADLARMLKAAQSGTDSGSDTRAGSLRGGSASGSDIDPDSAAINRHLAELGRELAETSQDARPQGTPARKVTNTGHDAAAAPGDDVDAASG